MVSVELAKDEQDLINALGIDRHFVFDISNSEELETELWVEYYEKGVHKQKLIGISGPIKKDTRVVFSTSSIPGEETSQEEKWTISILDDDGIDTCSFVVSLPESKIRTSSIVKQQKLVESQPVPLAAIIITKNNFIRSGYDLLDEESFQALMSNDYVYLLQMSVTGSHD